MIAGPPRYEWGLCLPRGSATRALTCEKLDEGSFQSQAAAHWVPRTARGIFGGQLLGLGVSAARQAASCGYELSSFYAKFCSAGDPFKAVTILAKPQAGQIKAKSWIGLAVTAWQDDRLIFTMDVTLRRAMQEEARFSIPLDDLSRRLLPPDDAPRVQDRYNFLLGRSSASDTHAKLLRQWIKDVDASYLEVRDAFPNMYTSDGDPSASHQQAFWIRVRDGSDATTDPLALLACISDLYMIGTVARSVDGATRVGLLASLDHTMYFYDEYEPREWVLFYMECQAVGHGRGVTNARFHRLNGEVIASVSQEGRIALESGTKL